MPLWMNKWIGMPLDQCPFNPVLTHPPISDGRFLSICLFPFFHGCPDNLKNYIRRITFQSRNWLKSYAIITLSIEKQNPVLSSWFFCSDIYLQAFFINLLQSNSKWVLWNFWYFFFLWKNKSLCIEFGRKSWATVVIISLLQIGS